MHGLFFSSFAVISVSVLYIWSETVLLPMGPGEPKDGTPLQMIVSCIRTIWTVVRFYSELLTGHNFPSAGLTDSLIIHCHTCQQ